MKEKKDSLAPLMNEQIRANNMQLINDEGVNIGIVSRSQALRMAEDAGLDLVLLADAGKEGVPVVKIMDFGKALYEKKSPWAKMEERLGRFFDKRFHGTEWREQRKEFIDKKLAHLPSSTQSLIESKED